MNGKIMLIFISLGVTGPSLLVLLFPKYHTSLSKPDPVADTEKFRCSMTDFGWIRFSGNNNKKKR